MHYCFQSIETLPKDILAQWLFPSRMHSELAVLQASNTVSTYNSFNSKSVIVHQPVYWAIIALAIGNFVPSVTKSCKHSLTYSVFIPFKVVLGVPVPDTSSDPLFLFRWCCVRTRYTLRGAWMMSWHMSWYMRMTIAELGWTGTNWNIWHAQKWVVMRCIVTIGLLDCLQFVLWLLGKFILFIASYHVKHNYLQWH